MDDKNELFRTKSNGLKVLSGPMTSRFKQRHVSYVLPGVGGVILVPIHRGKRAQTVKCNTSSNVYHVPRSDSTQRLVKTVDNRLEPVP